MMKRAHIISGILIVVMLVLMHIPGILLYPEMNSKGEYTGEHLPGFYGHPGADRALGGGAFPPVLVALFWVVVTFVDIYEPRVLRIAPGAFCMLLCLGVLVQVPSVGTAAVFVLAAAALAIQSVAFYRDVKKG